MAIGQTPSELPFALVNQEFPAFNCSFKSGCSFGNLSCRLTNYYDQDSTFDLKLYSNESQALEAVQDGVVWGYVSFDANYTAALVDRMWNYMDASQLTRNQSTTQVYLDMTNSQVALTLQKALTTGELLIFFCQKSDSNSCVSGLGPPAPSLSRSLSTPHRSSK